MIVIFRDIKNIPKMWSRIKKYGVMYYFDTEYRRVMKQRELNRKHRKIRGSGFLSRVKQVKSNLINKNGSVCNICKHKFKEYELTVDHIIKIKDGGGNNYKNLQLLCRPCHDTKDFNENFEFKPFIKLKELIDYDTSN